MQMDANAILPIYIDIDIHIGINIDRDFSIYKDRNIDFNKAHLVVPRFRASASNPMPDFYDTQPFLYGQSRYLLFILKDKQVPYVVPYPKKKKVDWCSLR